MYQSSSLMSPVSGSTMISTSSRTKHHLSPNGRILGLPSEVVVVFSYSSSGSYTTRIAKGREFLVLLGSNNFKAFVSKSVVWFDARIARHFGKPQAWSPQVETECRGEYRDQASKA